jgi:hypothetical protein
MRRLKMGINVDGMDDTKEARSGLGGWKKPARAGVVDWMDEMVNNGH